MSRLAVDAAVWHTHAATRTSQLLTQKFRDYSLGLGAPADLSRHLVIHWDEDSDGLQAGVDDPQYSAALEEAEYGSLNKAPLALMRRFEAAHGQQAAELYQREMQRAAVGL